MGRFGDLLLEVSRDPAMLIWLDNASNVKGSPNENFAREVMELFTMGHGNYTQQDVSEAARSLTGWTIDDSDHRSRFVFEPDYHDDGAKVLSRTIWILQAAKTSSRFSPAHPRPLPSSPASSRASSSAAIPRPPLAQSLQDLYASSAGDIREIVRAILLSDDFDQTADTPDMIKSPIELVVGAYRVAGSRIGCGRTT